MVLPQAPGRQATRPSDRRFRRDPPPNRPPAAPTGHTAATAAAGLRFVDLCDGVTPSRRPPRSPGPCPATSPGPPTGPAPAPPAAASAAAAPVAPPRAVGLRPTGGMHAASQRNFDTSADDPDVPQDALDHRRVEHERDDAHGFAAVRAQQRQALIDAHQQQRPAPGRRPGQGAARPVCRRIGIGRGCRQRHPLARLLDHLQRRPGRARAGGHRRPQLRIGRQDAAVPVLVAPRRGHQLRQAVQQLVWGQRAGRCRSSAGGSR